MSIKLKGFSASEPEKFHLKWFPICSIAEHEMCMKSKVQPRNCIYLIDTPNTKCKEVTVTIE